VINDTKTSEIPALGEGYSHARKAYGLTSALLMAWELIGVELEASPIENLKLTLKSPQAAPYVLIVLIIYFGFRVTIEWYQTDIRRRNLPASRIDFVAAHAIAVAALALYGFQTLAKVQVANTVAPNRVGFSLVCLLVGQTLGGLVTYRDRLRHWRENKLFAGFILFSPPFALGALAFSLARTRLDLSLLVGSALGLLSGFFLPMLVQRFIRQGFRPSTSKSRRAIA
jgi:hypothetical protein